MASRVLSAIAPLLFAALAGCTRWTSMHAGYALAAERERSVAGVELRRALGSSIHSGYGLVGVRADGNSTQSDFELHAGVMHPTRVSERLSFVPSATVELVRVGKRGGDWNGGALGPALAAELVVWANVERRAYIAGPLFGCMGGAPGVDCPRYCRANDVRREGLGVRASLERDLRFGSSYPEQNDWMLWLTVGLTQASSIREEECCVFDGASPFRGDFCR